MKKLVYILAIASLGISCNSSYEYNSYDDENEYYDNDGFEDGIYSATVDYYNSETGYSSTYTLDVEVEDNQVVIIYFPNNGYLDDDHIFPDYLDEDGYVSIEGEGGKTYDVQLNY